jgi:hypothetical protein
MCDPLSPGIREALHSGSLLRDDDQGSASPGKLPDYFDKLEPERLRRYLVKRLQGLGYDVTLSPKNPDDCAA